MKKIIIFSFMLFALIFINCEADSIQVSYYSNGNKKIVEKKVNEHLYFQQHFLETGELYIEAYVQENKLHGNYKKYYKSGNIKSDMTFHTGLKNGLGMYYSNEDMLESINLFSYDSLYFIEEYNVNDTVEFVKPIISLESVDSIKNKYSLNVTIPFEDFFKYRDDTIVVHYDIVHLVEGEAYSLPRKNRIKLYRGNETEFIAFKPEEVNLSYTIQGLVTVNDEPLKNFAQHFFQYTFIK